MGRRFETLRSVREAVELLPTLGFDVQRIEEERSKLRSEAAAALGLFDMRPAQSWTAESDQERLVSFDRNHMRYAQSPGLDGEILIYTTDGTELTHVLNPTVRAGLSLCDSVAMVATSLLGMVPK
ncbi:MAG: hypothetical protein R3C28_13900 [Pirellulaceae bacterium]